MTLSFDFIGIVTLDLAASLDFYRRLGVDIPPGLAGETHVEATLPGGMRLAWDPVSTVRGFRPDYRLPEGENRVVLAWRAESPAEVDRVYAALVGADPNAAHTDPWDAVWGQRYATVRDPDGNAVDLYAPLEPA